MSKADQYAAKFANKICDLAAINDEQLKTNIEMHLGKILSAWEKHYLLLLEHKDLEVVDNTNTIDLIALAKYINTVCYYIKNVEAADVFFVLLDIIGKWRTAFLKDCGVSTPMIK